MSTAQVTAQPLDLLETPLEDGTTVIEASAGTGKTYCLTGLVLRLLLERRVESIGQILVVTFTNAATDELVGRIRGALRDAHAVLSRSAVPRTSEVGDPFVQGLVDRHGPHHGAGDGAEILRNALLDFDDMFVSTIHGFCKRVLEESAFESGLVFDPELLESDEALRLDAARDAWRRLLAEDAGGELARLVTTRGLTPETFAVESRELGRHPGTEIVPEPRGIADATTELAAARHTLASLWRGAKIRLFLSRRSWKPRAELADAAAQRTVIAGVDAFCAGRGGAGLGGVEALTTLRIADQLRDSVDELAREPAFAALDAVSEAAWELEHAIRCRMMRDVESGLAEAKERGGLLAFDDLLHRLDRALRDPRHGPRLRRAVRQTLRVALVDEFQDTDLVQYRIFRQLFDRGPLYLVGDPKQAIYRFRGADVFAYLEAKRHADRVYTLGRNWRSSGALVQAVNALFAAERPFVYGDIPHPEVRAAERVASRRLTGDEGRPFQLHWLGEEASARRAEARLVRWTAAQIVRLLASDLHLADDDDPRGRPLRAADIAVLVRTNQQAEAVQEGLRRVGVPAVVSRSGDVLHSDELEELERVLRAVLDPGDRGRLKAACATLLWGMDAEDLHRLSDDGDDAVSDAGDRWQQLYDTFDGLRTAWREAGFVAMARRWLDAQGVRERLLKLHRGERRLTNLLHGIELLARAIHDERLTPAGLLGWLAAERRRAVHERDATELRLESDAAAVEIATVHKAKGLEYEVVLCPFLWQARPVAGPPVTVHADGGRLLCDAGSWRVAQGLADPQVERHVAIAEAERLAEDLRLLYVAVTRARRRCLVAWGAIGRGAASATSGLAYLLHRRQGVVLPDMDPSDWAAAALEQTRGRVAEWHGDLRRWADQNAELVDFRVIEDEPAAVWSPQVEETPELRCRRLSLRMRDRLTPWQIASFSSFSRSAPRHPITPSNAVSELPDVSDPALPAPGVDARKASEPDGIFAFARGPRAGQCLHDVLEALDFPAAVDLDRESEVRELVRGQLKRFGLASPGSHDGSGDVRIDPEEVVVNLLRRLATVRLPDGPRLASVRRRARLTEWQFWAPLRRVSGEDLAAVFRRHARAHWALSYADRLEELSPRQVEGYLTGYVDLAFEYGDRFFVVDWKSNHLGNSLADYDRRAMVRAMEEHHYFLQYHLYVVALRRYLRARGDVRSYDDAFGPVYYVFLRGLGELERSRRSGQMGLFGEAEPDDEGWDLKVSADTGVFVDRPPAELVDALDEVLFEPLPESAS